MRDVSFEHIDSLLRLDPITGFLYWKVGGRGRGSGKRAGGFKSGRKSGEYRRVKIEGKYYYEHRIAYLLRTGNWPINEIDHLDGDQADNKPHNIEDVTHGENVIRGALQYRNQTGYKGIFLRETGKYMVRKRNKYLGMFIKLEDAVTAYERAP